LVGGGASTEWDWAGSGCRLHFFDERAEVVGCEGAGLTPTVAFGNASSATASPISLHPFTQALRPLLVSLTFLLFDIHSASRFRLFSSNSRRIGHRGYSSLAPDQAVDLYGLLAHDVLCFLLRSVSRENARENSGAIGTAIYIYFTARARRCGETSISFWMRCWPVSG
jgi:hypothetical protein